MIGFLGFPTPGYALSANPHDGTGLNMGVDRANQRTWSARVRANAGWKCERCGSEEALQAHHQKDGTGISLCSRCHAWQHINLTNLIMTAPVRPWPNQTANGLARRFGVCNRTIIRRARRLQVPFGIPISTENIDKIGKTVRPRNGIANYSTEDIERIRNSIATCHTKRGIGATTTQKRLTYSVDEAAAVLGVNRVTVYEAIHNGTIPVIRFGRRMLIPKAHLDRLLGIQPCCSEHSQDKS